MKPNLNRPASLAAAPCSVELTTRHVIERKLLTALEHENTVGALLTKQDLEVMIAALEFFRGYHKPKARELEAGMRQLLREAFPPNEKLRDAGREASA